MKNIKTIITLLAIALINSFSSKANTTKTDADLATIEAKLVSISEIHISGKYDAQLIPGESFGYKVTCDAQYIDDLIFDIEGTKFKASVRPNRDKFRATLTITYPSDYSFENLEIKVSAGAKIDINELNAKVLDIDALAGAKFMANKLESENADINLTAGSTMTVGDFITNDIEIDFNSGSQINIKNVSASFMEIDENSGGTCNISGKVVKTDIDLSSAGLVQGKNLSAEIAELKSTSGANIMIGAIEKELNAKASTGGSISYSGRPSVRNVKTSTGGNISAY